MKTGSEKNKSFYPIQAFHYTDLSIRRLLHEGDLLDDHLLKLRKLPRGLQELES